MLELLGPTSRAQFLELAVNRYEIGRRSALDQLTMIHDEDHITRHHRLKPVDLDQ
jgi:hypothetical protein